MPTTTRGERTRARLIDATATVVRAQGYAGATTRAIAAEAGVSEATIYRHFADKTELFFAAVVERHAPVIDWMTQLPTSAGSGSLEANLTETLHQLATLGSDLAPLELAILADAELARRRHAFDGVPPGPPTYLSEYLRGEQARGRVRDDVDPDECAFALLAMLFGIVAGQIGAETPDASRLIELSARVFAAGLAPPPFGG
jgi:AcrR family transcriptional regulator